MNSAPGPDTAAARVDLAAENSFALGSVRVTPAALLLEATGWSYRLEPRAMQVLVVLAQASPGVAGREQLNARVWDGRVVGSDAINRAVQMLRRAAADSPGPPPFAIETVPRVGYRLTGSRPAGGDEPGAHSPDPRGAPTSRTQDRRARWGWTLAAVTILAALTIVLVWRGLADRHRTTATWRIIASTAIDDLPPGARDVAMSPDGRRLAYRGQDATGHDRIYVRRVATGGVGEPVSPAGADARRPAWNADGSALAFLRYDPSRPCRLMVVGRAGPARDVGTCEVAPDVRVAWRADGRALLFGDAPGWNAVTRITMVTLADRRRAVLSSPPGDSLGDDMPMPFGREIVFRRVFGFGDQGWIARDPASGRERLLWRRRGMGGSVGAALPNGALAVAWMHAGTSGIDVRTADGRVGHHPVAIGAVTAMAAVGDGLLVETDQTENTLVRADERAATPLASVRGRVALVELLPDGGLRAPATAVGLSRVWQRGKDGGLRPWGDFTAAQIAGLVLSPDGRASAALMTGESGREIVVFGPDGRVTFRWHPRSRSLGPGAWRADGRRLIVPVLDGAGWRLFAIDPWNGAAPRDLGLPGYAVVQSRGEALYAVRAGETPGLRELWRLDRRVRRLPIDLTLFEIVNWAIVDAGVWRPYRRDRAHPRLVLRDAETGQVLRSVPAPGLAGASSGLAADARGPVYVATSRDTVDYQLLTLSRDPDRAP